jgi:hypothetical protein
LIKLKGWEEKAKELRHLPQKEDNSDATKAVFAAIQPVWTLKGFLDLLFKWIVIDNQASGACFEYMTYSLVC